MREVTITIPAEHADAVRDDMLEELGHLAEELRGKANQIDMFVNALRNRSTGAGSLQLHAHKPGHITRLREWANGARADAAETLVDVETYDDPQWVLEEAPAR